MPRPIILLLMNINSLDFIFILSLLSSQKNWEQDTEIAHCTLPPYLVTF